MLLVTGATGRSGSWFLRAFAERRREVRSALRLALRASSDLAPVERLERELGSPVERRVGDLADERFVDETVRGATTILHIAGIRMSPAIVRAAVRHGVRWVVLVHTTGIYSKYKAAGEEYRRIETTIDESLRGATGPAITILRPTMIYGSLADRNVSVFIRMVDRFPRIPIVGDGRHLLQPVHERDLGGAYDLVLRNEAVARGRDYVLSGRDPIRLVELLATIAELLGRRPRFVRIPFAVAYAAACGLYAATLGRRDWREKVQRLVEDRALPHDDATRDLGYAPRSFAQGVAEEIAAYLAARGSAGAAPTRSPPSTST